jgi:DNA modification methylase
VTIVPRFAFPTLPLSALLCVAPTRLVMTHKMCRAPRQASACTRSRQSQKPLLSFALLPASAPTSHVFAPSSLRVGPASSFWVKEANPNTKERTKMNKEQSKLLISEQQANTVLQGDCVNVMRRFSSGSVDFVLTDPPYLAHYRSRDGRTVANDNDAAWLNPAFTEIFRVLCQNSFCISFYGWHQADKFIAAWRQAGFRLAGHLTFTKRYPSTERFLRYHHENAYLLAKGNPPQPSQRIPDVLEWQYSGNKLHPTQKPLCVLTPLIQSFSRPGDVVLDPFCGSGSTLLAARLLDRRYIGIELDPRYSSIAAERLHHKAA